MTSPVILEAIRRGLIAAIPETDLTVSQWAERYRVVSMERVADPGLAGMWHNAKTPYLVEIMDTVNDPRFQEVVLVKSAQVGGTECINNIIGYYIHIDPATILYICENEGKANAWSVECFAPMLRDTPELASIIGTAKMTNSNNTIESKSFRGGHFALAWATSPATLSSRPRRVVLTDETDAFMPTKEGDALDLAEARTKTAGDMRMLVHVSTPRDKETSKIEPMYENSTREKYFVPCPGCGEFQALKWANVYWDDDPSSACYVCEHCGLLIDESDKEDMIAQGKWQSTNPDYTGNRRGFWINEIYSPFSTWAQMAQAFLEAKPYPEKLRVFVNTRLAESWENEGEKVDYADLDFHRQEYDAEIPEGVLLLTAAVDVQDDRLEVEVLGWGFDEETWSIDYRTFYGSPGNPDVWNELKLYLMREFLNVNGEIFQVTAAAIDTGGHHTDDVYKFCKANAGRRWFAIKGVSTAGRPIVSKPSRNNKAGIRLYLIGTEAAKDKIYAHLRIQEEGPGYCHFPDNDTYNDVYFKMLCAEKKITKFVAGRAKTQWVKVSAGARNEALDCRVYNQAAYLILNPDLKSFAKIRRKTRDFAPMPENSKENDIKQEEKPPKVKRFVNVKSGFINNWR